MRREKGERRSEKGELRSEKGEGRREKGGERTGYREIRVLGEQEKTRDEGNEQGSVTRGS